MSKGSRSTSRKNDRPFGKAIWDQARRIARQYRVILEREPGGFLARAIEMPNVMVHGSSPNQCEKKAREALCFAVATLIEQGRTPPLTVKKRAAQVNVRLTTEENSSWRRLPGERVSRVTPTSSGILHSNTR